MFAFKAPAVALYLFLNVAESVYKEVLGTFSKAWFLSTPFNAFGWIHVVGGTHKER